MRRIVCGDSGEYGEEGGCVGTVVRRESMCMGIMVRGGE